MTGDETDAKWRRSLLDTRSLRFYRRGGSARVPPGIARVVAETKRKCKAAHILYEKAEKVQFGDVSITEADKVECMQLWIAVSCLHPEAKSKCDGTRTNFSETLFPACPTNHAPSHLVFRGSKEHTERAQVTLASRKCSRLYHIFLI